MNTLTDKRTQTDTTWTDPEMSDKTNAFAMHIQTNRQSNIAMKRRADGQISG